MENCKGRTLKASCVWQVSLVFALTYVASMFFPALSAVFKERIFKEAKEKLDGKDLDLFAGEEGVSTNVGWLQP